MKKSLFTLFFMALLTQVGMSQHTITLEGLAFSPNALTINVGETVTFDNTGGDHNVNGSLAAYPDNPEGFDNGAVAPSPWQFSHTFTIPGVYDYHCDPHVGFNMVGKITVSAPATGDVIISEIMYNPPSMDTLEFLELYNNGSDPVEMENWTLSDAVDFTFPQFVLMPGEYAIVSNNADGFESAFGITAFEFDGALNNSGEPIVLTDATSTQVDMVEYSSSSPWPNGTNQSIVLCDFDADNNDAANWASASTPTGVVIGNTEVLANPSAASDCSDDPMIDFLSGGGFSISESTNSVMVRVALSNGNAGTVSVDVAIDMSSTAVNGQDFSLALPATVTFQTGAIVDTQTIVINLIDDMEVESNESVSLFLENPSSGAVLGQSTFEFEILDNDGAITNGMVITGVFDAQPDGFGAKGLELTALQDIADLSAFGIGSANNGGGSVGQEITLPAVSVSEGDCIYVAADSMLFMEFFGFFPIAAGSGASINGDDAIELFENNMVIDVFGEVNHSGGVLDWDYLDGWAYRVDGSGPDMNDFDIENWTFSGVNGLEGGATNDDAPVPFPLCSYSPIPPTTAEAFNDDVTVPFNTPVEIDVLANDVTPIALTTMNVTSGPANGTAMVNGLDNITYQPNADYCGPDAFTYEICDAMGCDEATVNITVECPVVYTPYSVAEAAAVDAMGTPVLLGEDVELTGVVYGIDLQGVDAGGSPLNAIQFTLIDDTGGIGVFNGDDLGYTVTEGDNVTIQGTVSEFFCLGQVNELASLVVNSTGNPLKDPEITAFLNEDFESELIEVTNLELVNPSQWSPGGTGFNVEVKKTFANDTLIMRIDNDNELFNMPPPSGPFNAIGIGGQFTTSGNCLVGYQFLPRYPADIIPLNSTEENFLSEKIKLYPNPVSDVLFIEVEEVDLEKVTISNLVGQAVMEVENPSNSLAVSDLESGVYLITFQVDDTVWATKFVKN